MHFVVYILAFCDILTQQYVTILITRTVRIYIGSQNTWLYLQTVLFFGSFLLFDKNGLETCVCCKKVFVLFSERAHTRDSTTVATRVHLTIIKRTPLVTYRVLCISMTDTNPELGGNLMLLRIVPRGLLVA